MKTEYRFLENESLWRKDMDGFEIYVAGHPDAPDTEVHDFAETLLKQGEKLKKEGTEYLSEYCKADENEWFCDAFEFKKHTTGLPLEAQYSRRDDTYGFWVVRFCLDHNSNPYPYHFGRTQN